jgi:GcrA cell cycle regulator
MSPRIAEQLETVRQLLAAGRSWGEIGAQLGISRHAVSGMVRRYIYGAENGYRNPALADVERRPYSRKKGAVALSPSGSQPLREPQAPRLALVAAPPIPAPKHCQWPMGKRRPWHCCGQPAEPGRPYCAPHCSVAYVRLAA